jgi:hypothetical protein
VENEPTKLALKIGLHVQEFKAKHLRLQRHGMWAVEAGVIRLIHDGARVLRLFGNGSDSAFEDVALAWGRGVARRGLREGARRGAPASGAQARLGARFGKLCVGVGVLFGQERQGPKRSAPRFDYILFDRPIQHCIRLVVRSPGERVVFIWVESWILVPEDLASEGNDVDRDYVGGIDAGISLFPG